MPAQYERHARGSENWSGKSNPGRTPAFRAVLADQLADPVPDRLPPGRKDTRENCKGRPGRPHVPVIVPGDRPEPWLACKWVSRWDSAVRAFGVVGWDCSHRERCARCGKVIREGWQLRRAECPAYPGDARQKAEAEASAARRAADRPRPRRPVITGPQGYRRPKAGGRPGGGIRDEGA
jgi:hypothetical protein